MNKDRVYLFSNGYWCWCDEYSVGGYKHLGEYHEVVLGQGWNDKEVHRMLISYFEENAENIF